MKKLNINNQTVEVDFDEDTPLLWVIRDEAGLTGTKFGCGIAQCGACTVHIDGVPVRSCSYPAAAVPESARITTVEGLAGDELHPVQQAWMEVQVPQCGYCQSGQILAAAALLENNRTPSDEEINAAMTNICRCGTYPRIRKAIRRAAELMA
jgi:isoquinoline 1-oxidoreductase alpha subunit